MDNGEIMLEISTGTKSVSGKRFVPLVLGNEKPLEVSKQVNDTQPGVLGGHSGTMGIKRENIRERDQLQD